MDWRERDYYLIKTNYCKYAQYHKKYREEAPSIKYHSAKDFEYYGNFYKDRKCKYDWLTFQPQELVSVRKEESEDFEFIISYLSDEEWDINWGNKFIKLTKEMLGQ